MDKTPTARLYVQDAENAVTEILEFAKKLEAEGERPWLEVFYPAPEWLDEDEKKSWLERQESLNDEGTYDAVEVIDGEIVTLPSYDELRQREDS